MTTTTIAPAIYLSDALTLLAQRLRLSPSELIAYADEDTHGGTDTGYAGMSIHRDEGRLLYALVRALKPVQAVEIGVCEGVSTLHLLSAIHANGIGHLDSYDIDPEAGKLVIAATSWTFHAEDALLSEFPAAEFIFEDAAHTLEFSLPMYERLKLQAPRVLVVHDYYTAEVYGNFYVREAFESVFGDQAFGIKLHDCFRGVGVWINPDWQPQAATPARKRRAKVTT